MSKEREFAAPRFVGKHVLENGEMTAYAVALLYVARDPEKRAAGKIILTMWQFTEPGLRPISDEDAVTRAIQAREAAWETDRAGPLIDWQLAHTCLSFALMGPEVPA